MHKTVHSLAPFQGTMPTIGSARLALLLGGRRGVGDRHLEEPRGGHEVGIQQGLLELQRTRAPLQQVAEGQGGFAHQPEGGGGGRHCQIFPQKVSERQFAMARQLLILYSGFNRCPFQLLKCYQIHELNKSIRLDRNVAPCSRPTTKVIGPLHGLL